MLPFALLVQGSEPTEPLRWDVNRLPFTRRDAWVSVTGGRSYGTLVLHDVAAPFDKDVIAEVTFRNPVESGAFEQWADPSHIEIRSPSGGHARVWLVGTRAVALEAIGLDFRVVPIVAPKGGASKLSPVEAVWSVQSGRDLTLKCPRGLLKAAPDACDVLESEGRILALISLERPPGITLVESIDYAANTADADRNWHQFLKTMPEVPGDYRRSAELAWFNIWSCFLPKQGVFHYDSVVMSKAVMTYVWSWDHCFTALALAKTRPTEALDQWMLPFPLMNEKGCLPDGWKAPADVQWYATKPPIHGWAFSKLMDEISIPRPRLEQAYNYLRRWTEFWLNERESDHDGVPNYLVAGNDSGWDNATVFDQGAKVESPDLSAYLVLQMRCLARIARTLDRPEEARDWDSRADALKAAFVAQLWVGDHFVAKHVGTHAFDPKPTSLLMLMPLVLGKELPDGIVSALVQQLKRDFLTAYGPASEAYRSPKYESNGYWRGPIWAPATYLLADGLLRAGHRDLAYELAWRFCATVESAGGDYENFDALTGQGLKAPGYTWTAAVHLLFLNEFLRAPGAPPLKKS